MDIKNFTGDESRSEGVWIPYPDDASTQFKLTYIGENEYRDWVSQRMARARKGRKEVPGPKQRAIVQEAILKFLLKDWKGITRDGKEFPFNYDNAKELLSNSPSLRDFIVDEADNIENFGGGDDTGDDETEGASAPAEELKSRASLASKVG